MVRVIFSSGRFTNGNVDRLFPNLEEMPAVSVGSPTPGAIALTHPAVGHPAAVASPHQDLRLGICTFEPPNPIGHTGRFLPWLALD